MSFPNHRLSNKLTKQGYRLIAGVDEAGRGALAGPIVAAAVIMPTKRIKDIKDSKLLTPQKRQELFIKIKKEAKVWGIASVSNIQIDKIGINPANRLVMEKAIIKLGLKPQYVLIDGNLKIESKIPHQSVIKGDYKVYCIAAASILAKVHRDNLMRRYHQKYPSYGLDRHKGYGTSFHRKMIKQRGSCPLHRQTFRTL